MIVLPMAPSPARLTNVPAMTAISGGHQGASTRIDETFVDFLSVNAGLGPAVTAVAMLAVPTTAHSSPLRTGPDQPGPNKVDC